MKRYLLTFTAAGVLASSFAHAQTQCSVNDPEEYYKEALDEEYKVYREALAIAEGLFRGPLMKEGGSTDVASFRDRFVAERDMELGDLQELVRRHLFGESKEYQDMFERLRRDEGSTDAAMKIRDSIYTAYGFEPRRLADEKLDACLVASGQAHLVVTRALVDFMERKNLD